MQTLLVTLALSRPGRRGWHALRDPRLTKFEEGYGCAHRQRDSARAPRDRCDVDSIPKPKGDRARLVPLHPTATEALRRYASVRERLCPRPRSRAFFLSSAGTPVLAVGLRAAFREITTRIGIRSEAVRPRIHDLRHRFAVQTLIDWQHRA